MGTALRILGRLLFVCTSAVLAMVEVPAGRADTVEQVNFTVQVTTGSENGDVFTGAYTYDGSLFAQFGTTDLLSFTFTDSVWMYPAGASAICDASSAEFTLFAMSDAFAPI